MKSIQISTKGRNMLVNITSKVQDAVGELGVKSGAVTIYCPHSTAAITINEKADPAVQHDILGRLNDLVPMNLAYDHAEGNSDAHIKASLIGSSAQVLVEDGRVRLGTWQAVYFCEFDGPREREVWVG